jgi:hypothetical protein
MSAVAYYVLLGTLVAGFVQGLSGFAFGLVAMTFWVWVIKPQLAGPLVVFGSLIGQMLSLGSLRHSFDRRRLWPFILGGCAGTPIGVWMLHRRSPSRWRRRPDRWRDGRARRTERTGTDALVLSSRLEQGRAARSVPDLQPVHAGADAGDLCRERPRYA